EARTIDGAPSIVPAPADELSLLASQVNGFAVAAEFAKEAWTADLRGARSADGLSFGGRGRRPSLFSRQWVCATRSNSLSTSTPIAMTNSFPGRDNASSLRPSSRTIDRTG